MTTLDEPRVEATDSVHLSVTLQCSDISINTKRWTGHNVSWPAIDLIVLVQTPFTSLDGLFKLLMQEQINACFVIRLNMVLELFVIRNEMCLETYRQLTAKTFITKQYM